MNKLQQAIYRKKVALIGNASSIFEGNYGIQINSCDIVIRMNGGFIRDTMCQGSKTDILVLSLPLSHDVIKKEFNPWLIIWATSKRKIMPHEYKNKKIELFLHPLWVWFKLRLRLNARPSTGAIIGNYITSYCKTSKIEMYGFDFFKTKTFYNEKHRIGPHSPCNEEVFFHKLISSGKIQNMQAL